MGGGAEAEDFFLKKSGNYLNIYLKLYYLLGKLQSLLDRVTSVCVCVLHPCLAVAYLFISSFIKG